MGTLRRMKLPALLAIACCTTLAACGGDGGEAPRGARTPKSIAAVLAPLAEGYVVDYEVTRTSPARALSRGGGVLVVGVDPRYDLAFVDREGYTAVTHGDTLWRRLGDRETVREVGAAAGELRPLYLPVHQTPVGLARAGDWRRDDAGAADGGPARYVGVYPREGFPLPLGRTVEVEVDERAGRIASITTELLQPGRYTEEVRWDFSNWRTDLTADPEAAARVAALLP